MRAGAGWDLLIGEGKDGVVAGHIIVLRQGFIAQFAAGEGLQAVLRSGDQLHPWRGLPQKHPGSSLVGEPDEEEIQVAAVVDGQAARILDLQGVLYPFAVVLVSHRTESNESQEAENLEHRDNT